MQLKGVNRATQKIKKSGDITVVWLGSLQYKYTKIMTKLKCNVDV